MNPFDQVHDPGLQQERTVLAWDRTGLALMVASGLLIRAAGQPLLRTVNLIPALAFLLGLAVVIVGRPRYVARWRRLQEGSGMLAQGPIVTVALASTALAITALLVVFT